MRRVRRFSRRLLLIIIVSVLFAEPLQANNGVYYKTVINGVEDREIRRLIQQGSETISLQDQPPMSPTLLRRRAEQDLPWIDSVLKTHGFFNSTTKISLRKQEEVLLVIFSIEPGPLYVIEKCSVTVSPPASDFMERYPDCRKLGMDKGVPAERSTILETEDKISYWFRKNGYPFPQIQRHIVVDHAHQDVSVSFDVHPGPCAVFGSTSIHGLESVQEDFIHRKIAWKAGDPYNGLLVEETHEELIRTRLFALVEVSPGTVVDPDGQLPVNITLQERLHRTVKPGISYTTDEGLRGKIAWEHRNAFRNGEKVEISAMASDFTTAVEGNFRKEEVLLPDQALIATFRLAEDRPDAYTSRNASASVFLERFLTREILAGGGVTVKESEVKQLGERERYGLLSFPLYWKKDTSDNLLDPHSGWRLFFKGTPYLELHGNETSFFKGYAYHTRYERIMKNPLLVLALRSAVGFTIVSDKDDIPADERYYAGGGNSIRGFDFQSVGPREKDNPTGGGSLFEVSAEGRFYLTERLGTVLFVDGGSAFSSRLPDFGETIRWGAGLGLRYLTAVGPLRADIAFPINRRHGIDDSVQVYISFGQAF